MHTAVIMDPGFRRDDADKKGDRRAASRIGIPPTIVMAGLVPAIHVFAADAKAWMRGTSPRMTNTCGYVATEAALEN
jgi:hypothetical protein